jgi:para-nitrobenzyl esterase
VGPSHGADNACLWARPPRFVERPLSQRPGADMTAVELAVTEALPAFVPTMVTAATLATGVLADWGSYDVDERATALFDAVTRVKCDPSAERRRTWAELAAPLPR